MRKNRTNILSQQGFIQIPILIISIIGFLAVSGGGYYVVKEYVLQNNQSDQNDVNNSVTNETIEDTESATSSVTEREPLNLEDYKLVDSNRKISNNPTFNNLDELLLVQKEIKAFQSSLLEKKNKMVTSEKELSNLRIENVNELKDIIGDTLPSISLSFDEIIAIENIRQKNIGFILGDIFLDLTSYELNIKKKISNFDTADQNEVKSLLYSHNSKMSDYQNRAEREITETLEMTENNSKVIQASIESLISLAGEYSEVKNSLNQIKSINNQIVSDTNQAIQNVYYSIPKYEPLTSSSSLSCNYPTDKYILVPNKGWVKVKQCSNGTYIEASKYVPDRSNLTPQQKCDLRKAGALANNIGGKVDCSDLGL